MSYAIVAAIVGLILSIPSVDASVSKAMNLKIDDWL